MDGSHQIKKILCHSLHPFQVIHEPGDDYINVAEATALGSKVNSLDLDSSEEETGLSDGPVNFPAKTERHRTRTDSSSSEKEEKNYSE